MSHAESRKSAPSLQLRGLQHHGQPIDFSWQWPHGPSKVGFDTILSGLEGVDPALLAQAQSCSVQRVGPVDQPVWLLSNRGDALVCSVNQQLLAAGSQLRLDQGDEIELGLTRLVVWLEPSPGLPGLPSLQDPEAPAAQAQGQTPAPFDLTELDAHTDTSRLTEGERFGLHRADFADLISLAPQEPELLAAPPQVRPADTAEPSLADAPAEPPAAHDPLQSLHNQYLAKLRDPVHGDDQDLWSDIVRGAQSQLTDPMQQWMQAAGPSHSLDDLLGQAHSIASVIQGLDALGASDVLAPEPFDSVMHLFAPEHLRERTTDSLETLVQRSLPGLTRREHHSLSVDSAMPFTGGEDPPPASQ